MSIATAIQNAQGKVAAAYTKCNAKGATMPLTQDLDHLDDCIDSIPTGSSPNLTTLPVTPTTSAQVITPTAPVDGYNEVDVAAVTSAIDSNIQAGNIKKDVTILGVTGTYEGSGGGTPVEKKWLTFYDYEGTILFSYTKAEALLLRELPAYNKQHTIADGATTITFVKWNHTLAQIRADIANRPINVGATVKPTDGKTHFDMIVPYDGVTFQITTSQMNLGGGTLTVDWGDGTTPTTGTLPIEHTYANAGHYWVSMYASASSVTMASFGMAPVGIGSGNSSVTCSIREMYLAENFRKNRNSLGSFYGLEIFTIVTGISDYAPLANCNNLRWFTIPAEGLNFDAIGTSNMFLNCYAMKAYSLPPAVTNYHSTSFNYNTSIEELSFPNGSTFVGAGNANFYGSKLRKIYNLPNWTAGQYIFRDAKALVEITFSSTCVNIGTGMFYACTGLRYVEIPSTVTAIQGYVFAQCTNLVQVIMRPTTPPSIGATTFNSNDASMKIYVPYSADHSVLADYKGASNWLNYASQIYELDENGNVPTA